ncbi:ABC transporter ATP-binding protein [Saccharothrix syringae]|uniref:ABC transporter ATP-binding protein n=1 Tax=Saccharothrix syringae TaxID=103733 RepID=A0A5Q0GY76_SACSY|nr:ABC transporter ATP-binding protein [Saccharothrix syringae]QFZ18899.1 ABC transporter ATP-binding protein [Saccharothrix syringae]
MPENSRARRYWAEAVEPRFFLVRRLGVAGAGVLALGLLTNTALGVLPVAFVVAAARLVGHVPEAVAAGTGGAAWDALVTAFLVASGCFVAQQVLAPVQTALAQVVKHRVDGHFYAEVIAVVSRSASLRPVEDERSREHLHLATETLLRGEHTPGDAVAGTLALVARYVRLVGFGVVIGVAVSWWSAVAVCAGTMVFRYGHRGGLRMWTRLWPEIGPLRRESDYFRDVGMELSTAKELRVFGLTGWVVERYRSSSVAALLPLWRARRVYNVHRFVWFTAIGLVLLSATVALMLRSAVTDSLSLTALLLGLQATVGAALLGEFYQEADVATQFGMLAARALADFERHVDEQVATESPGGADARGLPRREIRFRDVSFGYAGSDRLVLDGLDLTLRAGECTALVGLNGAGKTTLVKLLGRLYEPTSGAVLVDGVDVRELDVASWRRQLAVVFQDFNRYELPVRDNIAFGALDADDADRRVVAAARRADVDGVVAGLPGGYGTVLSRQYRGGADLSGGQWQRVAIARALYAVAAGARVLLLDEPTSALDVRAEAAFFDEFAERTRGVTTLLISHRFSSVRHADRIVVLAGGRVVEDGTHEALLARGGRYAELYHLQAEQFAQDAGRTR